MWNKALKPVGNLIRKDFLESPGRGLETETKFVAAAASKYTAAISVAVIQVGRFAVQCLDVKIRELRHGSELCYLRVDFEKYRRQ